MSKPREHSSSASSPPAKRNGKVAPASIVPPQAPALHPASDDREGWRAYWTAQRQSWRTSPEIDLKRQEELAQCLAIAPNIEQSIYPFKDMKLSRADIEWLLSTHENGRGPVDWRDENQRHRSGLDVRGADLSGENLENLPLARLRGALTWEESFDFTPEQSQAAVLTMERAVLKSAHLEGAILNGAFLAQTFFTSAHLEEADLQWADLAGAELGEAHLEEVCLREADLPWACLTSTHLENANLIKANLNGAELSFAHLEGATLLEANLEEASLWEAFFDCGTRPDPSFLTDNQGNVKSLLDLHWGDVNLAVVNWSRVKMLGDEATARKKKRTRMVSSSGEAREVEELKDRATRLIEHEKAVRVNRQLAVGLQAQGLNEEAVHFAYQAQILRRRALWHQIFQPDTKTWQRMRILV